MWVIVLVQLEGGSEVQAVAWEMKSRRVSPDPAQGTGAQVEQEIVKEVIIVGEAPEGTTLKVLAMTVKPVRREVDTTTAEVARIEAEVKVLDQRSSTPTFRYPWPASRPSWNNNPSRLTRLKPTSTTRSIRISTSESKRTFSTILTRTKVGLRKNMDFSSLTI